MVYNQEKPSTFWTQCPICWVKLQYYREFLDRLLRCQICHNTFQARELLEDVDPEFLNHKEPPKQCPQDPPNTFWTECSFCCAKFQYYRDILGRLLCCQICQKAFEAHEVKKDVHPEQGPSNLASESSGGSKKGNITRFQDGDATFKPELKIGTSADFSGACNSEKRDVLYKVELGKQGVETSKSGSVQSNYTGTSRHMNKKRGNSTFESGYSLKSENRAGADSQLSGGHPRKFPRKRQNLSSSLYDDSDGDDDDLVQVVKSLRKGQFSGVAEKKRNIAATGVHKKEAKEIVSFPLDKNFPNKKRKTEEFELKVKEAAMLDKEESNFKADVSSAANVATLESIEVPDPQFHKFVVDADMLANLCHANQTWALYDTADGMPRFYAIVKKVLTPGFKLKVSWLDADPDDQGEIDWCEKELPVACGKFRLGDYAEITDHLMFSHQMHTTTGSLTGSVLVYPRKGETWAIYQNWDIGWSSEPEKHVSYKYEFVEVLSDFVEGDGIGVSYLGKVKGFVSLFQRTEQHGFQVPPDELYRFSHRIPSFKMTGHEGYGVPSGSFELDPASLPSSILIRDVGDLEIDNRRKNTEPSDLSGEFVERLVL